MPSGLQPKSTDHTQPVVGLFDSGVGGLSVLRALRRAAPQLPVLFVADQAHVPYGPRSLAEVRRFSEAITRFLLGRGVRVVTVACNTASAAALHPLRDTFPGIPFVGMEPAVKPAAEQSATRIVGVLATPATFEGELYASVVARFARGLTVVTDTCPGLVAEIEAGRTDGAAARTILERALAPMLARGIDTVVLGCTHYPFVIPLIEELVGPGVRVIDPAPAVARQVLRVLGDVAPGAPAPVKFLTSGDPAALEALLPVLLGEAGEVGTVTWSGDALR